MFCFGWVAIAFTHIVQVYFTDTSPNLDSNYIESSVWCFLHAACQTSVYGNATTITNSRKDNWRA